MAVDGDVVGWIGKDEIHPLVLEKAVKVLATLGVAAKQAVSIEQAEIARARGRRRQFRQARRLVGGIAAEICPAVPGLFEHEIDFGQREAGNLDAEVEVHEGLQLDGEQLVVPTGI
jgi:hypothetical protein